ncbi:MAG TPA: pectate lyase [Rheinheimera sp.]|uniref:pectate lyase n=1 Tax=Rheinheimera sp. TaxID=1869214 RepID=UPI002B47BB08|nr:pectate lyase [Rheinheimera sp.]HJS15955.1 pectate lyase [Rheinheimera sp.]
MLVLRAALWSLSLVAATSAAEPLTLSWRQQLVLDPEWQQYFSRSEYLRQLDQQQLQQELTQLHQHAPTLPAKDLKFGFPLQPNPAFWLSAEANRIAKVILSFQTPSGGWSKRTDMASQPRQPGQLYGTEVDYIPTFDNDATSTQILWLTAFLPYASEAMKPELQQAIKRAIGFVLAAQYPNGGFAQSYPLRGGYHDAITLNDHVMTELLKLLNKVATEPQFAFVESSIRQQAKQQFLRGIKLLLTAQIRLNGELTVWAAQHHPVTLEAVKARAYELPALVSSESAEVTLLLMQLPKPSATVIQSVEAAVAWFKAKQIHNTEMHRSDSGVRFVEKARAKPLWARFYDLEKQQPLFVDRDGRVVSSMAELSIERQNGYGWYQSNAEAVLKAYPGWRAGLGVQN